MKSIRVKTGGWIVGRNGAFDITAVELEMSGDENVVIEGIGKHDVAINGGLRVSAEAMDELAERWLAERKAKKGKSGVCPVCGKGLEYIDGPEYYDDRTAQPVKCSSCEFGGFEWADTSFAGYTDTDDNDVP